MENLTKTQISTCGNDLINAAKSLKSIVEGIDGTMKHGTWRDDSGRRLKDTAEWVAFYNAISSEGYVLVPIEPTLAMIDAVNSDMAEQRSFHIHIFAADVWAAMLNAALSKRSA